MALWNKVVSGFDREEETVNFGARTIAENNGALYETSTIATIQSDGQVPKEPRIFASVEFSRACIAIDMSITIFKDETCEEVLLSISFGSLIMCYCVSENGSFLFVVLKTGTLYCLHLLTGGKIIFTRNITNEKEDIVKIFLQPERDECIDAILVAKTGAIYRVSKLNMDLIEAAIESDSDDTIKHLAKDVQSSQLFNGVTCNEVIYAALGTVNGSTSVAMVCKNSMFLWPGEQYTDFQTLSYKYRKVHFLKSHMAMLCLRTDNFLNLVCPRTLLGLKVYNEAISDFTVIENSENNMCQIIMLTVPKDDSSMRCLCVISFPEREEKFRINVLATTYLVEIMNSCDENILYLEGVNELETDAENIDTIRLKTVLESIPECQLERLLRRGQFDTAEAFAEKFSLSVEPICCAKAALFMSQLGPWAKKSSERVQLDALISILDNIGNVQYVVECCSKALIPEYKEMRKLHLYARKRIVENVDKMKNEVHLRLLYLINDTLHKLETFHMIWGCQINSEHYDEDTMKEWIRFSRADFMSEYKTRLRLGEIEAATLIWTRHFPSIMKKISISTVQDIFGIIPDEIAPSSLWPWFSHFIPTLMSLIPDAICEIIFWGYRKIKTLEQSCRANWPQIGIDFANRFIKLLRFEENHQSLYFHQKYSNQNSALKQFVLLMQAMSDIQKLKVNFRLTVSLDSYLGEPMEVSHVLLNKIHVDIISEFVSTFLKQYMLNHSLQNDEVFSSYIQKTIRNSKTWWCGEEAPWEKRVVTLISLIQNIEIKLQQTLDVLRKAPVPWSSIMLTLAESSSILDHELSYTIRTECNYVPIKLILKKYGYECIGINEKLIYRIIKESDDDMIMHINQIAKNDTRLRKKAFSSCVTYYLNRGNIKKAMEVLDTIEDDILLYCCIQIVNHVTACLSLKSMAKCVNYYIEVLSWVKVQLRKILKDCKSQSYHCNSIIDSIEDLKSLYVLKKDFQTNVTIKEYQTEKKQVLARCIKELCNDVEKQGGLCIIYKKIIRITDLLKLQRSEATSLLMESTKSTDVFKYFAGSEGEHFTLTKQECRHVSDMCLLTLQHVNIDPNIGSTVLNLSASALCGCSNGALRQTILPNVLATLYCESFCKYPSNSIDGNYREGSTSKWELYPAYRDLAIGADQLMLSLFKDMVTTQIFYASNTDADEESDLTDDLDKFDIQTTEEKLLNNLLHAMKRLKVEHNDYCLLQIAKALYLRCCVTKNINATTVIEARTVFLHFLMTLLRKLISARTFDLQLGLSCLFMLPEADACKWISSASKSFQVDYMRHLTVSVLGYEYFRMTKNQLLMQTFKDHKALHRWARKLSKYSISYKEILLSDNASKREILQRVMNCDSDNMVALLQDFCCNFGFNIHDCYLLYLQALIKTWNPKLNISAVNGRKELHISEEEVSELKNKCDAIVAKIPDKTALKNCVTTVWSQINFYLYEVFIILMDLIDDRNTEHRNYICFLQNYTRSGQPTQIEREAWMNLNPGHTSLPAIAEWRLPFLPKIELWKLITPELNLKTYQKWLDIAPILKLQQHIVCTLAIKGEVTHAWENIGAKYKTDKWTLCSRNTTLLNDIKKCIERMTGPDALYYGTAALYYVVNHTPPGADQVAAAQECYTYAQLSAQKSTVFEEGMLEKIKFKYLRFTSEHILRTHGLGKSNYLTLISNPYKLVRELYMDESIPQRYRSVTDHRPDINAAVAALSKLFSINLVKLRVELLQEWLQPDSRYTKINQSITDTFSITAASEQNSNHDDNLLRACYILEHGDIVLSANFLINIGFGDSSDDYGPEVRYRALHVLQTIIDTATLEDLTKRDSYTIRQYMKFLKYVGKLESLGLGYSVSTFEACSKHELVQILWKTQCYTPQALGLIAQICTDFEVYDYSLWDKCLTQMAKLLMVDQLKRILLRVRNVSCIVNSDGYLSGWQVLVSEPFRKMDLDPNSEQIDGCIEALRLLYSCPIVHMLYFSDIINYCFQCQQPHLAAAFLPFLNDDDQKHVLKTIKLNDKDSTILEDLNNLSEYGILSISCCQKILKRELPEE